QLRLSPGSGFSSYLWNDGSTKSYNIINGAGVYWVRVTGAGGCTATDSIVVTEFIEEFSIDLGDDITYCAGTSVNVQAPDGDFTSYLWSTGSTETMVNVAGHITLSLSVTNDLGCIATDSIIVSQNTNFPYFEFPPAKYLCP